MVDVSDDSDISGFLEEGGGVEDGGAGEGVEGLCEEGGEEAGRGGEGQSVQHRINLIMMERQY